MQIKETNVTVNVANMDKSIEFYESIGLKLQNRWGDHYAQLVAPGIIVGLNPTSKVNLKGNSGNVSIGFTTDDFEGAKTSLQNLPINVIERQEEGGQFLHFDDPDGTALYVIKPKW